MRTFLTITHGRVSHHPVGTPWRNIPITLIMALRWALECNGLITTVIWQVRYAKA